MSLSFWLRDKPKNSNENIRTTSYLVSIAIYVRSTWTVTIMIIGYLIYQIRGNEIDLHVLDLIRTGDHDRSYR